MNAETTVRSERSPSAWLRRAVLWCACAAMLAAAWSPARAAAAVQRSGTLVRVGLPFSPKRVKRKLTRASETLSGGGRRGVLVLEFSPERSEFGQGVEYTDALALAELLSGRLFRNVTTVAYIRQPIKGHAVLAVMACDQIVMAPEAAIGEAGIDENPDAPINPNIISAYREIASRKRTIPREIALALLDKDRVLLKVETETSVEYVSPEGLEELKKEKSLKPGVDPQPIVRAGAMGYFTAHEARDIGLVQVLAKNRESLARELELPLSAVEEAPAIDWKTRMVVLDQYIDSKISTTRRKLIDDAVRNDSVNFLCVWLDSPGADPAAALELAGVIADLRAEGVRTVAFIPQEARGYASLVAVACDHIVMRPGAIIGGPQDDMVVDDMMGEFRRAVLELAEKKAPRSRSVAMALVDPDLVVYRYRNRRFDLSEFLSESEFKTLPRQEDWARGEPITTGGDVLQLDGDKAEQFGLARDVVGDFEEFKRLYGLENDPELVEPGWLHTFLSALARTEVAMFLLLIGGAALYAELQMPGIGVGGFVATVCFVLFFWANYLNGTAGALEIILFLVGVTFLLLELFVIPGFGIFGLGGGLLVIASLILASQTFVVPSKPTQYVELRDSLLVVAGAGAGIVGLALVMRRFLPSAPMFNRIMLEPPHTQLADIAQREAIADFSDLVGQQGTAATQLTPAGKARLGDRHLDVVSDGDLIRAGEAIEVVETHGNRIVVRPVKPEA